MVGWASHPAVIRRGHPLQRIYPFIDRIKYSTKLGSSARFSLSYEVCIYLSGNYVRPVKNELDLRDGEARRERERERERERRRRQRKTDRDNGQRWSRKLEFNQVPCFSCGELESESKG